MNMKKTLSTMMVLFTLLATQVGTATPTYAASVTYTATKLPALAFNCPYHSTISIQNNALILSGNAPDYVGDVKLNIDLIQPVNYLSQAIGTDGIATITKNTAIDLNDCHEREKLKPNILKTLSHTLDWRSSRIEPIITVTDSKGKSELTYAIGNVPKLDLSDVPDGIYNVRLGFSINSNSSPDWIYCVDHLYCDDILIVVQWGKANLQVLPLTGQYDLDKYNVQPAITIADQAKWMNIVSGYPQLVDTPPTYLK